LASASSEGGSSAASFSPSSLSCFAAAAIPRPPEFARAPARPKLPCLPVAAG
jgi:hypothetical protein